MADKSKLDKIKENNTQPPEVIALFELLESIDNKLSELIAKGGV